MRSYESSLEQLLAVSPGEKPQNPVALQHTPKALTRVRRVLLSGKQ